MGPRSTLGGMDVDTLRPHLHRLRFERYQAYLWSDADGTTLVDTGEPGSGRLVEQALATLGLARTDLDRIVLTHFHDDHAGSAAEIAAWGGIEVVAHAADAPVIAGEQDGPPPDFTDFERQLHAQVAAGLEPAPPVSPDTLVRDGDLVDFAGGAEVLGVPGHTDGSIALWLPQHRVLFTGDIVAEHEGQVMPGVFNLDRDAVAESFRRLAALDSEVACFGHGEPLRTRAGERLREVVAARP